MASLGPTSMSKSMIAGCTSGETTTNGYLTILTYAFMVIAAATNHDMRFVTLIALGTSPMLCIRTTHSFVYKATIRTITCPILELVANLGLIGFMKHVFLSQQRSVGDSRPQSTNGMW
jgi:hypothetical protein